MGPASAYPAVSAPVLDLRALAAEVGVRVADAATHDLAIGPDRVGASAFAFSGRPKFALPFSFSSEEDFIEFLFGEVGKKGEAILSLSCPFSFAEASAFSRLTDEPTDSSGGFPDQFAPAALCLLVLPENMFIDLWLAESL